MSSEERLAFESYVNLVERCMNLDADPCDNFLNYACGRFKNENFDKKNGDWPPSMLGLCEFENILDVIAENEQILDPSLDKVKDFMVSKRASLEHGLKVHPKTNEFITFCGGLPAFTNNWNDNDFNWARTIGILQAIQCYTILILYREYDKREFAVCLDHSTISDFSHIDKILDTLELDNENRANIVSAVKVVQNYLSKDLNTSHSDYCLGKNLQRDYSEVFDFCEFIETALCLTVSIENEDVITIGEGVVSFLSFLNGLDRTLLANYLTFLLARNYYHAKLSFNREVGYFAPIVISIGFAKYFNEKEDQKRKYLRDSFSTHGYSSYLFDDTDFEHVDEYYKLEKVRAEYESLHIIHDGFYQNLCNISNYGIPYSLKAFLTHYYDTTISVLDFLKNAAVHWNKPMVFHFSGKEFTNWLKFLYNEKAKCFFNTVKAKVEIILNIQVAQDEDLRYGYLGDDNILRVEAIARAYSDYKIWMDKNTTTVLWQNKVLSRINLDCHKLFFVAFAQHWICCKQPKQNLTLQTLMNFKEFVITFECTERKFFSD